MSSICPTNGGDATKNHATIPFNHLQRLGIVAGITLGNILVFAALGGWLDGLWNTGHKALIILLLLSIPATHLQLFRAMRRFSERQIKKRAALEK